MTERKRDMKKQTEWSRNYNEKAYDRLYITVPKGQKEELKAFAASQITDEYPKGESLNEFVIIAINERIERLDVDEILKKNHDPNIAKRVLDAIENKK
nr:hypothetical protein [uncultured Caproiciproducens sp.]